jgi:hypothetical protein
MIALRYYDRYLFMAIVQAPDLDAALAGELDGAAFWSRVQFHLLDRTTGAPIQQTYIK